MRKLQGAIKNQEALQNKNRKHIRRACLWGAKLIELEGRCYREGLQGQDIAAEANKAFRYFYKQLEEDLFPADIPGYDRGSLNRYRKIYIEELIRKGNARQKKILRLEKQILELKYKE